MPYAIARLGPVIHDGVTYYEGQEIPGLTPEQADALLACGVISAADEAPGKVRQR